jgi:hypothetical protein
MVTVVRLLLASFHAVTPAPEKFRYACDGKAAP